MVRGGPQGTTLKAACLLEAGVGEVIPQKIDMLQMAKYVSAHLS